MPRIEPGNPFLSRAMRVVLRLMIDGEANDDEYHGELINSGRTWMVGLDHVNGAACQKLLSLCLLREVAGDKGCYLYEVTAEGRRMMSDGQHIPAAVAARQRPGSRALIRADGSYQLGDGPAPI